MVGYYPISLAGEEVGKATVTQEGMFWRIQCTCRVSTDIPWVIRAGWGEQTLQLGICAREGDRVCLMTRINKNKVPAGRPVFTLAVKHLQSMESFVPIVAHEPFAYISRLKNACLVYRGGQAGILLDDQTDRESPTGQ